MALKSGSSHALAALASLVTTQLLLQYCGPAFPALIGYLQSIATLLAVQLLQYPGVAIASPLIVRVLMTGALAFGWGAVYHWSRHGDD